MSEVQILNLKALAHAKDGTIVPVVTRKTLEQVDETLAAANEVYEQAQFDARSVRADAFALGHREGTAQAHEAMTGELVALQKKCHALFEQRMATVQELALAIVERLAPHLDTQELVKSMVSRAILAAQAEQYLVVRVHPRQVATAREAIAQLGSAHPAVDAYEVVADDRIVECGCAVETEAGVVRSSWDQQIKAMREALGTPDD